MLSCFLFFLLSIFVYTMHCGQSDFNFVPSTTYHDHHVTIHQYTISRKSADMKIPGLILMYNNVNMLLSRKLGAGLPLLHWKEKKKFLYQGGTV